MKLSSQRKKFTEKYPIFVLFTFKVPRKFTSWASKNTKVPNCIVFSGTNYSGNSHGGISTTNNISFQLSRTFLVF